MQFAVSMQLSSAASVTWLIDSDYSAPSIFPDCAEYAAWQKGRIFQIGLVFLKVAGRIFSTYPDYPDW
jgi:hypothetical protein